MSGRKPDERIRTPMQWSADGPSGGFSSAAAWQPLADDWQTVNVAAQDADPDSLLTAYRALVRLRTANAALLEGATTILEGGAEPGIGWRRPQGRRGRGGGGVGWGPGRSVPWRRGAAT